MRKNRPSRVYQAVLGIKLSPRIVCALGESALPLVSGLRSAGPVPGGQAVLTFFMSFHEVRWGLRIGGAEQSFDLDAGLGFVFVLDIGGHRSQSGDDRPPVVAITCAGNDIRDQIHGENEISQSADDHALRPGWGIVILEAVKQNEGGEQGFASGDGRDFFQGAPQTRPRIPMGCGRRDGWHGWHGWL